MTNIEHLIVFFLWGEGGGEGEVTFLGKRDRKIGYQGGVFYNVQKYTGPLIQFSKLSKPLRRK